MPGAGNGFGHFLRKPVKRTLSFSKFLSILLTLIFIVSPLRAQTMPCKDLVCFEPTLKVSGTALPIKGVGSLKYLMLELYTAALYAPPEATTIDMVLGNVPKSLVLHYHRMIKKEWMIKASRDRISKNPDNNPAALEERLRQLDNAYQKVEKGDRYELSYEPGVGTSLILNGKLQATIPGEDFQRAFFGIWLSRLPINKKLRDKLIAGQKNK